MFLRLAVATAFGFHIKEISLLRGEIVAIGDELTSGQRLDTNSQWLSQQLGELGVEVVFHTTVADDLAANIEVFQAAIARADVVVSTGGLGPTADDLTREALAATLGVELVCDEEAVEQIRHRFASRGRSMPDSNLKQADMPRGAWRIDNPHGTAPGVRMEIARTQRSPCHLYALPGVPAEMHEMWRDSVVPAVRALVGEPRVICHRRLKCFGAGESHIESMLPDLVRRGREPRVGITASGATITLRVTASADTQEAAFQAIEPTLQVIREKLGVLVYGEEDDELQDAVTRLLAPAGLSLATSESWTEGLLASWLRGAGAQASSQVGSSDVNGEAAVLQLADETRAAAGAHFGLAIGSPEDSLGAVTVALAHAHGARAKTLPQIGHPSIAKPRAAKQALNMLRLHLLNAAEHVES